MPPLEKKKFTPLQNVKGIGKVVNPFTRELSCQISQPPRASEVLPQQPAIQQTVHVPPPVVVETAPQAARFTPPVFTAAPRQYIHPTARNSDSIPAIPHRSPGQVTNDYHPIISTQQEPARVPADQYWRSGTQEYRPYIAELMYDYSNHASTYRGYGIAGAPRGPLGGPPYGGVMQMGGISEGNLERERDSRNGSFRGVSGGGGPGGLGGPGSPGGPPDDPDNWGSNHNAYWHPANGWVAIPEFNQQKDQLNKEAKLDVKKPDPFNGSDRWKWEPFLSQVCRTFMAKPTIYKNNSDKIGFAVSYLTGAAATHYDNLLKQEEAGIPVPALCTWINFVVEFMSYFRLFDPAQDTQEYAFKTGYNDTALVAMLQGVVQQFQELDNSICATNAAHSCGGNSSFGMYNPTAPSNPQNSNPRQGSNNNNPQQAGGQQGRNQDNISGMVYGQSEDFASTSSQNGNSGEGLENQGGNNGISKNPGDEEFLQAIQAARTPEQVKEFCRHCKLGLCYNCGGSDHINKDCKNRENWDPPKNGTSSKNNQQSDQLRAATFILEGDPSNNKIWNVKIENNSGKVEGIPETH
ncbi:hypothetical protein GYMLUDRAFT_251666 [Collybiopsis luxurians FD-317 M1]|uniref:CCHC-type domain-containing protein n=1 Tax=Collybiopsis luxurians FD-317 M1 TaxID=944289 RepID=A0A0D0BQK3_9AGAR|nr:hypothetical protein GYMLUDRAFT_251666 [Collybiopsis luxurians FD-317 M1]